VSRSGLVITSPIRIAPRVSCHGLTGCVPLVVGGEEHEARREVCYVLLFYTWNNSIKPDLPFVYLILFIARYYFMHEMIAHVPSHPHAPSRPTCHDLGLPIISCVFDMSLSSLVYASKYLSLVILCAFLSCTLLCMHKKIGYYLS
jgi:hypothetical protein